MKEREIIVSTIKKLESYLKQLFPPSVLFLIEGPFTYIQSFFPQNFPEYHLINSLFYPSDLTVFSSFNGAQKGKQHLFIIYRIQIP